MALKVSIRLNIPVHFRHIANGERIIEQTGPDEYEVEVLEGDVEGESRIEQLHKLWDEYEREARRVKAQTRRSKITAVPSFSNGGSKQVNGNGSGEGGEANKSPKVAGHGP